MQIRERGSILTILIQVFLKEAALVSQDLAYDVVVEFKKERMRTVLTFEKGFMFDGTPFLLPDLTALGTTVNLSQLTVPLPLDSGIAFCMPTHYKVGIYDPSIVTLFAPLPSSPSSSSSSSHTLAIVLGSIFGAVGLLIVVVILLALFVPSFRLFFRPFSAPRSHASYDIDPHHTHPLAAPAPTPSWSPATRPSHPL